MDLASKEDIIDFLFKFKSFAQTPGFFSLVERDKNMQSIAELGITVPQALDVILQLTCENYSSGPEVDHDYPEQSVWVFGTTIDGEEIYIKLSDDFKYSVAKCISFHKADFAILYPYQGGD